MQIEIAIIGFNRSLSKTWPLIHKNLIKPLASQQNKLILNGVISHSKELITYERTGENHFSEIEIPDSVTYKNLLEFDQKEIDIDLEGIYRRFLTHKTFNSDVSEKDQPAALLNLLRYLYLQSKYVDLIDGQTELIIFIRPDLMPIDKFYFKNYFKETKSILTPNWGRHGGHNDRFAIIPVSLAHQYFNRFQGLDEYVKNLQELQAEKFLKWSLRECPPKEIVIERMIRIRASGLLNSKEEFIIPHKFVSNGSFIKSMIREILFKIINLKRRYFPRPFLKYDLTKHKTKFSKKKSELVRVKHRVKFAFKHLFSSFFNKFESKLIKNQDYSFLNSLQATYINLESRTDRDSHIKKELKRMGLLNYERFPAISHENGAIGCTRSHLLITQKAIEKKSEYIFVFEDDIRFLSTKKTIQKVLVEFMNNSNLDVLCIGNNVLDKPTKISHWMSRTKNTQTASCYVMKASTFNDYVKVLEEGLEMMKLGDLHGGVVDIIWKKIQTEYVFVIPNRKLLVQKKSYSNITNMIVDHLV
jgi:hypothetical protein